MTRRVLGWCGLGVAVTAAVALAVVFVIVGLHEADRLASVVGAFIGLAGLVVAVFGLATSGRSSPGTGVSPGGVHNHVGGAVSGTTVQARDIRGNITFGKADSTPSDESRE